MGNEARRFRLKAPIWDHSRGRNSDELNLLGPQIRISIKAVRAERGVFTFIVKCGGWQWDAVSVSEPLRGPNRKPLLTLYVLDCETMRGVGDFTIRSFFKVLDWR